MTLLSSPTVAGGMGLFPKDRNLAESPDRVEIPVRASDYGVRVSELTLRLDAFLGRHLHWRSRNSIQTLIRDGFVSVDPAVPERALLPRGGTGRLEVERRVGRKLRHGSLVVVRIPPEHRLPEVTTDPDGLRVLYEDDDVLVVDKPPFLPVHPSGRHLGDTLIQRVHARYQDEIADGKIPIRLCHRLDRETSGLVLCGKGRAAHRKLMIQFERRKVEKEYLALVVGRPEEDAGVVDLPLGPARVSAVHLKMAVLSEGMPSRTRWRVLERRERATLVSCVPETGRQHQIRVHMQAIGHPLVGDKLYGHDEGCFLRSAGGELSEADLAELGMPRHALHNHRLRFRSPSRGEPLEVESPLAEDMQAWFESC